MKPGFLYGRDDGWPAEMQTARPTFAASLDFDPIKFTKIGYSVVVKEDFPLRAGQLRFPFDKSAIDSGTCPLLQRDQSPLRPALRNFLRLYGASFCRLATAHQIKRRRHWRLSARLTGFHFTLFCDGRENLRMTHRI